MEECIHSSANRSINQSMNQSINRSTPPFKELLGRATVSSPPEASPASAAFLNRLGISSHRALSLCLPPSSPDGVATGEEGGPRSKLPARRGWCSARACPARSQPCVFAWVGWNEGGSASHITARRRALIESLAARSGGRRGEPGSAPCVMSPHQPSRHSSKIERRAAMPRPIHSTRSAAGPRARSHGCLGRSRGRPLGPPR